MLWETNPTNLEFEEFSLPLFVSDGVRFILLFYTNKTFSRLSILNVIGLKISHAISIIRTLWSSVEIEVYVPTLGNNKVTHLPLNSHSYRNLPFFLWKPNETMKLECFFCYLDPAMLSDPKNATVNVTVGKKVALLCRGEGYPTPMINLTEIYINGSQRNRLSGESNLTIVAEISFWFQCTVENYLAKQTKWFHLGEWIWNKVYLSLL